MEQACSAIVVPLQTYTVNLKLTEVFLGQFFSLLPLRFPLCCNKILYPCVSQMGWPLFRKDKLIILFIYLFGVLRRFQHCTGHITTGSWKGRGNQYIQFVRVLYCKLPTNSKQLPAFPLEAMPGIEPRPQRWEARVLPLFHCGP